MGLLHPRDQVLLANPLLTSADHNGRAVGVVGTDVDAAVASQFLEPHPDIGLEILDQVAEVDGAIRIRQGAGDENLLHGNPCSAGGNQSGKRLLYRRRRPEWRARRTSTRERGLQEMGSSGCKCETPTTRPSRRSCTPNRKSQEMAWPEGTPFRVFLRAQDRAKYVTPEAFGSREPSYLEKTSSRFLD